jgi:recombination protein RecA
MSDVTEWIPSGFIGLDEILGGGWPVGRASEVFGDEGCGKSALAHMAIKGVQSIGGIAVLLDYEAALDEEKILQLGIDPERLIYEIPDHIEQGWDIIWAIMEDLEKNAPKAPMLIVWDSIGGAVPKAELDATSSEKPHVGEVARAMSRGCRRMFKVIAKVRAHMMWISQERHKIGGGFSPFGPVKETSGGKGPKYASSVRLRCARVKTLKRLGVKARATGYQIKSITKKNKVAPPEQNMEWVIDFKRGPSPELSTLQTLLDAGVVRSSGGGKYRMKGLSDGFKKSEWINRMRTASFRKAAEAHCLAVVRAGGALAAREADETVENEE